MQNTLTVDQLIQILVVLFLLVSAAIIIYTILQPAHYEKANKTKSRHQLTPEEIDRLFDAVDPINETLPQRFSNN